MSVTLGDHHSNLVPVNFYFVHNTKLVFVNSNITSFATFHISCYFNYFIDVIVSLVIFINIIMYC